jgi:hypothetical protein
MKANPKDKVNNVSTPDMDPSATRSMFAALKKRKRWNIYGPDKGPLIPRRSKKGK